MKLVPVLEFQMEYFKLDSRPYPDWDNQNALESWNIFWSGMLADHGVGPLKSYAPRSEFVRFDDVTDDALVALLKLHEENYNQEDDRFSSLPGGFIWELKNGETLEPRCCAAIGDVFEWGFPQQTGEIEGLWMGHDEPLCERLSDGQVRIFDPAHGSLKKDIEYGIFTETELDAYIDDAKSHLAKLAQRLKPHLIALGVNRPEVVSKVLCGFYEESEYYKSL